jgi:hypothetical protein
VGFTPWVGRFLFRCGDSEMNFKTLQAAITETERFLKLAKELQEESQSSSWIMPGRISGATRRASMDLTRALADLRRPT